MSANSGTSPTITPGLLYHDAAAAIEWLCRAFGIQQRLVVPGDDGKTAHAHLALGNDGVMLSSAEDYAFPQMCKSPRQLGGVGSVEVIVFVADVDTHCARAVSAGVEILIALENKPYGGRRV